MLLLVEIKLILARWVNLSWECICSLNRLKFHCRILCIKLRLEAINRFLNCCAYREQCFLNFSADGLIYHVHPYKKQLRTFLVEGEAAFSNLSCWMGIT